MYHWTQCSWQQIKSQILSHHLILGSRLDQCLWEQTWNLLQTRIIWTYCYILLTKKEISISFGGFNSYTIPFEVDELHSKQICRAHVLAITLSLEHTYYVPPKITPKSHVRVFLGDMFPSFIWGQFFQAWTFSPYFSSWFKQKGYLPFTNRQFFTGNSECLLNAKERWIVEHQCEWQTFQWSKAGDLPNNGEYRYSCIGWNLFLSYHGPQEPWVSQESEWSFQDGTWPGPIYEYSGINTVVVYMYYALYTFPSSECKVWKLATKISSHSYFPIRKSNGKSGPNSWG